LLCSASISPGSARLPRDIVRWEPDLSVGGVNDGTTLLHEITWTALLSIRDERVGLVCSGHLAQVWPAEAVDSADRAT
jgi:hypothetical protein